MAGQEDRPRPAYGRAETRRRIHLAPVYVLLIAIIVLAVVVSVVWPDQVMIARFGPNLATESLGILLTVVFVRRFMEHAERSRRLRSSAIALRKSRRALQDIVDTWTALLKGCLADRPTSHLTTADLLIEPERSELLLSCDPSCVRAGGDRWVSWASARLRSAQDMLDQVAGTYGNLLDPEYVEALDALIADPFVRGFHQLAADVTEPQPWRVALNTVRGLRMSHFERLLETLTLHNRVAFEVGKVRGGSATPRTSSIGVELPPDHDLRVDFMLDDGWWRSSPRVGALRTGGAERRSD
jgi:hypothetical protein